MNPRQLKISGEIYNSLDKFCKKHGFVRKALAENAIMYQLKDLQGKLQSTQK